MKKFCIIFLLSIIISVTAIGLFGGNDGGRDEVNGDYIRIHIRADSNDGEAQAVKYAVRDELVKTLTPIVAECESFEKAKQTLKSSEALLSAAATKTLKDRGFSYGATATLKTEYFPTRKYGDLVLASGEYLALVVELGSAQGQNWWCVIYPPLCFAGQANTPVTYKSKIAEIIEEWRRSHG
ncbi:MAG: stage II sporulation protein R [Clostridia bacterium]|nr:stage II sporulation protein R [Clostridia bacterium]